MKIIGITGKSGSGKSTLATVLAEKLNCKSVNIDKIGHQATQDKKNAQKLCAIFGNEILGENQEIERKKLGNIVFASKEKMEQLTEITWGYMQEILDEILKEESERIVLEWALLPVDRKYWDKCDIKIWIKANDQERKEKVIERDQITEEYFARRDSKSIDYSPFKFDYIFTNDYEPETMERIANVIIGQGGKENEQ